MAAQMTTPGAGGRSGAGNYACTDDSDDIARGLHDQPRPPCIACRTQVSQRHHLLCRSCWAWRIAGQHLRSYVGLTRLVHEGRK